MFFQMQLGNERLSLTTAKWSFNTAKLTLGSFGVLLDVALEVNFSTLGKKAFASFSATFAKDIAACFGAHAGSETVLAFADTLGWLVSAFHIGKT